MIVLESMGQLISSRFTARAVGSWHTEIPRGFTLIEGIIACGIISTALIVGLSLAYSNLTAAQINADRVIAGNLAREGIEVMRNVRDSNWIRRSVNIDKKTAENGIQFYTWDDILDTEKIENAEAEPEVKGYLDVYLDPDFGATGDYRTYYSLKKISDPGSAIDLLSCIAGGNPSCRVQKKNGVYFQSSALLSDASPTQFYRRIIVKPVCWNGANEYVYEFDPLNPDNTCQTDTKIGNLIISHVMWQRGAKTLEVKVKEKLYNWRTI